MSNDVVECSVEEVTAEIVTRETNFNLDNSNSFPEKLAVFFEEPVPTFIYDPSFEDELRKFLAKQKELDNLRNECAKRLYSQFSFPKNNLDLRNNQHTYKKCSVYLNGNFKLRIKFYLYHDSFRAVTVHDFRSILILLCTPYAEWINKTNLPETFIDLDEYFWYKKISHYYEDKDNSFDLYIKT